MPDSPRYFIETLGCPKNQVDSDKLAGQLEAEGYQRVLNAGAADLVVINTCAFIDAARTESVDTVLALADERRDGARLVVTGCMAERYGEELAGALPEVDQVAGFGVAFTPPSQSVPVTLGRKQPASAGDEACLHERDIASLDLLNLPRPASAAPWGYLKIAEGCDRFCGFCAIPSFRGPQRSRTPDAIVAEAEALGVKEVVLVAQDLASYGKDRPDLGAGSIVSLIDRVAKVVPWTRLLYLYPSDLSDELIDVIGSLTGVPYFDLSLQHVSKPLLRRMRRWGDADRFLARIQDIRSRYPDAAFRSNYIVGYPGETEADHDKLLSFVRDTHMDWVGFFAYSEESGTYAADLDHKVPVELAAERLAELRALQDDITVTNRAAMVGRSITVLVDDSGIARSTREAPEIDGVIKVPVDLPVGEFCQVTVTAMTGPDLHAEPIMGEGVGAGGGQQS